MIIISTSIKLVTSIIRNLYLKLFYGKRYKCHLINSCAISTKIIMGRKSRLIIGRHLSTLYDVRLSVGEGAKMTIGDNVNFNNDCIVVAKQSITIGNHVIFGPGCKIYDHDHNYKKTDLERKKAFVTAPITIGDGVWFGADCIILKGTQIGNNCVFGAGSVIKGLYDDNTLVVQERTEHKKIIPIKGVES